MSEWASLRVGLAIVGLLVVAALVNWAIATARYEDPGFRKLVQCLVHERGFPVAASTDPVAGTAELGAIDTVVETNPVTVSVASDAESAERIAARYRSVGGDLGTRLEVRGRAVYLWESPPSPTQRQTLFDCTY